MLRILLAVAVLAGVPAFGAVFVVPHDESLIKDADAIVVAHIRDMNAVFDVNGDIVTELDLEIERVLKGDLPEGQPLRIRELGGIIGTRGLFVSESATYWIDNRALIFLQRHGDGWRTYGTSLGKFDFVEDHDGRNLAVRWATRDDHSQRWTPEGHPHEERLRDAEKFLTYISRRTDPLRRQPPSTIPRFTTPSDVEADYFVDPPSGGKLTAPYAWDPASNAVYPPSAYTQGTFRWDVFDNGGSVTFFASGTQPGYDHIGASQRALAAWTSDAGSNVDYRYGGTNTRGFVEDNVNTIVYNSASDVPAGALAYARWYAGNIHTYKGEQFYSISEGDVAVRSGITTSQKTFEEAVTHELGHTLGFRHSDQGTPSSTQAVMKAILTGQYGASLGPWDIEAVRTVYTGVSTPPPPVIPGTPTGLVATATGTTTVSIAWNPASNATSYIVERATRIGQWVEIARVPGASHGDSGLSPNTTFLYRVRAANGTALSTYSNLDHATTVIFTDDPLIVRVTRIKAIHLTQIRTAVNAVRIAAGLSGLTYTDPNPARVPVKAVHINELRTALSAGLSGIGKSSAFTGTVSARTPIRAIHFQELRNLVK
jgi:hypothetical protein